MIELFRKYPRLADSLPYTCLGNWPTPVTRLRGIERDGRIYMKDDSHSGEIYGGNKVRKLEFLLADALARGCREVMTFGVAGSNHALATALYAQRLGLRCISILTPQTNARYVATNLLAALSTNAELHHYGSEAAARQGARYQQLRHRRLTGKKPAIIAGGGSSALGTIGFVNAAFELSTQIANGELPEPDRLYVALGTMGTAAGLLLGLRACGHATEVVPVRVVRTDIGNLADMRSLCESANALLRQADPDFPSVDFDITAVRDDQYGQKYAVFTENGVAARRLLAARCGVALDGTYTAKTVAALLADRDMGRLAGRNVLYWHTYNAVDLQPRIAGLDYRMLPHGFHTYFERPVQPLDS